jgi:hypothetical protein
LKHRIKEKLEPEVIKNESKPEKEKLKLTDFVRPITPKPQIQRVKSQKQSVMTKMP